MKNNYLLYIYYKSYKNIFYVHFTETTNIVIVSTQN